MSIILWAIKAVINNKNTGLCRCFFILYGINTEKRDFMNKKVDILKSKNYNEFLKTQLKLNKLARKSSRYKKDISSSVDNGIK